MTGRRNTWCSFVFPRSGRRSRAQVLHDVRMEKLRGSLNRLSESQRQEWLDAFDEIRISLAPEFIVGTTLGRTEKIVPLGGDKRQMMDLPSEKGTYRSRSTSPTSSISMS